MSLDKPANAITEIPLLRHTCRIYTEIKGILFICPNSYYLQANEQAAFCKDRLGGTFLL